MHAVRYGELASERNVDRAAAERSYGAIVAFVRDEKDIAALVQTMESAADGDNILLWVIYPEKSSKKHKTSISRDTGWNSLLDAGWDGVRQVAFDADWSALRFRLTESIRSYTRKKRIGSGE
jgi:hypothetical protein